jgi:hypothetical protein
MITRIFFSVPTRARFPPFDVLRGHDLVAVTDDRLFLTDAFVARIVLKKKIFFCVKFNSR